MVSRFVTRQLAAAVMVALLCQGCALSFLDKEFNNRGGFADYLGDRHWIKADTKQMRILRAYVLIGSLLRMSRDNFSKAEREVLIQHVNSAINAAQDAFSCAYDLPGRCVYFDERIVELETSVLRIANAVFTTTENENLFGTLTKQFNDTLPLLKGVSTLADLLDAMASTGQLAANASKLIASLVTVGEIGVHYGTRIGALYRDSIELHLVTVIGSSDAMCQGIITDYKNTSMKDTATRLNEHFQLIDETVRAQLCVLRDEGLLVWQRGSGDLNSWQDYLENKAVSFSAYIIPRDNAFIQASDLIWRACEQLTDDETLSKKCVGFREVKQDGKTVGVDRLILYLETKDARRDRLSLASARIDYLSRVKD